MSALDRTPALRGALEAIDRILNRGADADDVLRAVLGALHERAGFAWAGIAFVNDGVLANGPETGRLTTPPASFPVAFAGATVAELRVSPAPAARRSTRSWSGWPPSWRRTASSAGIPAVFPGPRCPRNRNERRAARTDGAPRAIPTGEKLEPPARRP
ncbi:MAG: hypothetical protein ABR521_01445 [Gaiellaceae bacterium]